jgi:hypothetical protein
MRDAPTFILHGRHGPVREGTIDMIRKRVAAVATMTAATAAMLFSGAPSAQAASQTSGWVMPGGQLCVTQYAGWQVRGEATVQSPGLVLRLRKTGGSTVATSAPYNVIGTWNAEGRTSLGNFPGSGEYRMCANNNGTQNVYVTKIKITTDAELP